MALPQQFLDIAKRVNNWGRWGEDDERGTLNLITPDVVRRGAACAKTGKRFSLAIPLGPHGPKAWYPGRTNAIRTMMQINRPRTPDPMDYGESDDVVFMGLQSGTHWDALAHVSYGGKIYNGFPASSVDDRGASRCGIDKVGTLVSRAVLLDVARAHDTDRLEPGYAITRRDLDAAEEASRTRVQPGDVVLIRTGHMMFLRQRDVEAYAMPSPGLSMEAPEWFYERDVAAVATDNMTFEVMPQESGDVVFPVHLLDLVDMGLMQGQNFDLEHLAADCADDGVYEMFLSASPEPFARAVGGPVNPVAIK